MDKKFGNGDERLGNYCSEVFRPVHPILQKVLDNCAAQSLPKINVNEMDGRHLEFFVKIATGSPGSKNLIVEIGTLGGYSAICMALALPPEGKLISLELNQRNARIARENISMAGLDDKIEVRVGNAAETLKTLTEYGPFDLIFIDADKAQYPVYGEWAVQNLRKGGVLLADNTFAWGLVLQNNIDNPDMAENVKGIRSYNNFVANEPRLISTLFPTGEGLTASVRI